VRGSMSGVALWWGRVAVPLEGRPAMPPSVGLRGTSQSVAAVNEAGTSIRFAGAIRLWSDPVLRHPGRAL
jgi:hypothetical protein